MGRRRKEPVVKCNYNYNYIIPMGMPYMGGGAAMPYMGSPMGGAAMPYMGSPMGGAAMPYMGSPMGGPVGMGPGYNMGGSYPGGMYHDGTYPMAQAVEEDPMVDTQQFFGGGFFHRPFFPFFPFFHRPFFPFFPFFFPFFW